MKTICTLARLEYLEQQEGHPHPYPKQLNLTYKSKNAYKQQTNKQTKNYQTPGYPVLRTGAMG